jgi:hypothetical protein
MNMTVSSTAVCPNPAHLGVAERTSTGFEPAAMETSQPSITTQLAIYLFMAFGVGVSIGASCTIHIANRRNLTHRISILDFPKGSRGAGMKDATIRFIQTASLWVWLTSSLPQTVYEELSDSNQRDFLYSPQLL